MRNEQGYNSSLSLTDDYRRHSDHLKRPAKSRTTSTAPIRGINSQAKKHVHVAGGDSKEALEGVKGYFTELGFDASIVEDPLLLATTAGGRKRVPTLMPLSTSSAFAPTKALLDRAYVRANADPNDPDPDLDIEPGLAPKWSTQSLTPPAGGHGGKAIQRGDRNHRSRDRLVLRLEREVAQEGDAGALRQLEHQREDGSLPHHR